MYGGEIIKLEQVLDREETEKEEETRRKNKKKLQRKIK